MVQCGRRKSNMEKKMIMNYKKRFDEIRYEENGIEFWYARELMHLLDYSKWQNFENVLSKAKVACANNGIIVEDHFADTSKMVTLGSGANREVEDYMLTRYACYLISSQRMEILVRNRLLLHKEYMSSKEKNLTRLIEYAVKLGVRDEVMMYVEVMV